MTVKPLIPTGIMTEFGMVQDDPTTLFDEQGAQGDLTYVPGFSDMRRARDRAIAEGKSPTPLPVNLRWVRRTRANGKVTNERTVRVANRGYVPVKATDVGKVPWLTAMPAGATKLADGSIGSEDMVLMVCDGPRAGRNAAQKTLKWLEFNTDSRDAALAKAASAIPTQGTNPEVTTEPGTARQ